MHIEEMRLDGNAAAGALREIFVQEMTVAIAICGACGTAQKVGALLEYGHTMGVVLRCPGCDAVMLRFSLTPGWLRLDASGASCLMIPNLATSGRQQSISDNIVQSLAPSR